MDIALLNNQSLKLKSKKTTLAIDPKSALQKFDADAILIIDKDCDISRINNYRVIIDEAGEYEISGLKIAGIKSNGDIMFRLISDNVNMLVAKASSVEKFSADKIGDYQIAIINVDTDLNQSLITAMEPRVLILYGEKAKEAARALGKEDASISAKISVSEDKLPEEMEVMILA